MPGAVLLPEARAEGAGDSCLLYGWRFHAVASAEPSQGLVGFTKGLSFAKALRKPQLSSQGSLRCCSAPLQGLWVLILALSHKMGACPVQPRCVAVFLLAMLWVVLHLISNRDSLWAGFCLDFSKSGANSKTALCATTAGMQEAPWPSDTQWGWQSVGPDPIP